MVIGGTGMLAGASRFIAAHACATSLFARTRESLAATIQDVPHRERCACIAVDYRDAAAFACCIDARVAEAGSPDLVLAWFHGEELALKLAGQLATYGESTRFFHVVGSARGRPDSKVSERRDRFEALGLAYRSIVLGFVHAPPDSRWLTHEEISRGVIDAVQSDAWSSTLGTLEPWSMRP